MPRDRIKPVVTITSPAGGASVTGNTAITATATDNLAVKHVQFYVNGSLVGTSVVPPYSVNYNFASDGIYNIEAIAYDKAGNFSSFKISVSKSTPIVILPPPESPLPSVFLLDEPPIWAQGGEGSCVAMGVAAQRSIEKYYTNNDTAYNNASNVFSPEFLYNNVKAASGCGSGTSLLEALNFVKNQGVCTWSLLPYDATNGCSVGLLNAVSPYNYVGNATEQQIASAAANKITSVSSVLMSDRVAVKTALAAGHPLVMALTLDSYMYYLAEPPYIWDRKGTLMGGHVMLITGYDDTKGTNGCYRVRNSYGTAWCDSGHIWLDYLFAPQVALTLYKMVV